MHRNSDRQNSDRQKTAIDKNRDSQKQRLKIFDAQDERDKNHER